MKKRPVPVHEKKDNKLKIKIGEKKIRKKWRINPVTRVIPSKKKKARVNEKAQLKKKVQLGEI